MTSRKMTAVVLACCAFILAQTAALHSKTAKTAPAPKITIGNQADYDAFKKLNPVFLQADKRSEFKPGDTFCVELETNPTTGYDWYFTVNPEMRKSSLSILENRSFQLQKKPALGAPSLRVIRFKTLFKGNTTIVFKYYRSWEGEGKAAQTKKYEIRTK